MKPRIYCFGNGWALRTPYVTFYEGSFTEVLKTFQETTQNQLNSEVIQGCLEIVKARMGQVQTAGNA